MTIPNTPSTTLSRCQRLVPSPRPGAVRGPWSVGDIAAVRSAWTRFVAQPAQKGFVDTLGWRDVATVPIEYAALVMPSRASCASII